MVRAELPGLRAGLSPAGQVGVCRLRSAQLGVNRSGWKEPTSRCSRAEMEILSTVFLSSC